ncbi:MAG: ATP-binding cassette domain-containing protein [Prevotella sp.]|nr:ATP-binding cassette domain-containing protein [Prevotella sp.]
MDTIRMSSVLPQVFSQRTDLQSDVWCQDVSFEKGHIYLVEAESGQGKSTFCSYVVGYRNDYSGKVLFDHQDTRQYKVSDWVETRRRHISHLFQELRLFPELTALENVQIKNKITQYKSEAQIMQWFDMLGIADKVNAKVGLMSFGQQQRVAMIRALVQPFDFILADEPISHLDDNNAKMMGQLMMAEVRSQGAGVIVTSIGKHIDLDYERVLSI